MLSAINYSTKILVLILSFAFFLTACGGGGAVAPAPLPTPLPDTTSSETVSTAPQTETDTSAAPATDAYPAVTTDERGYPAATPEGLVAEPPNPPRDLPAASSENAVVGGVLIREILETGFVPLTPRALALAEVLYTNTGEPSYIREGANSPQAEVFPTGIFLFREAPPGEYGLMVDVGFTKFPILQEDGTPLVLTLTPGQVLDLGQIITEVPGT